MLLVLFRKPCDDGSSLENRLRLGERRGGMDARGCVPETGDGFSAAGHERRRGCGIAQHDISRQGAGVVRQGF